MRSIGGVSLFDFQNFNYRAYDERYPSSDWREFVHFRKIWCCAVWIEIDRTKAAEKIICGPDLIERWKKEGAYRHRIMPRIEAAYIGDLSCGAFVRALLIQKDDEEFLDISKSFNLA